MPLRINLFGGPGSGKSTTAAWLFSELKQLNYPIELVGEYVKKWTYMPREVKDWDQIYLFGKQLQSEFLFLNAGKNIVTDSPTILAAVYAKIYYPHINISEPILQINKEYDKQFPSLNIFLNRKDKIYDQSGRYQTYKQAKKIDEVIKETIKDRPALYYVDYDEKSIILDLALQFLDEKI